MAQVVEHRTSNLRSLSSNPITALPKKKCNYRERRINGEEKEG
jgi:hypothetical protein